MEEIITTESKRVGDEIRSYVRDHFELRERLDLTPLDDLATFVSQKVAEVARKTHGQFLEKIT